MAPPKMKLESEKYLHSTAESKYVARIKSRIAVRALLAFFIGIALIPAAIYAGEHVHEWTAQTDQFVQDISGGKYALPRVKLPNVTFPELSIWKS